MPDIFQVQEIFTPTSPAKINFIERNSINTRLVRAMRTPGTQIIVYGQSGSGKTTIQENKLYQIYENHIKTSCMKGMSFESVLLDGFDQLAAYYLSETTDALSTSIEANIKSSYGLIDFQIKSSSTKVTGSKSVRILPPQLTAQNLTRFMGAAGYCWVLDDFHKIQEEDKEELSQLLKVFMDMSNEYKELKIICVGAVNTARQVVQYDPEMKNRVAEIKVPLMSEEEINQITSKGFKLLNISIDQEVILKDIFHYSNGLASICHKLCLLICECLEVEGTIETSSAQNSGEKVSLEHLAYAIQEYLDDASDTIKHSFDRAFAIDSSPIVLEALSECGEDGECIDGITEVIRSFGENIKKNDIVHVFRRLECETGESLIRFDADTSMYSFTTPFIMTFARSLFEHSSYRQQMSQGELMEVLNNAFRSMRKEV